MARISDYDDWLYRQAENAMSEDDFEEMEQAERQKHDAKVKELEEEMESKIENNPIEKILELKSQIVKLNEYARSICINREGKSNCKYHWDCSDCMKWEMKK